MVPKLPTSTGASAGFLSTNRSSEPPDFFLLRLHRWREIPADEPGWKVWFGRSFLTIYLGFFTPIRGDDQISTKPWRLWKTWVGLMSFWNRQLSEIPVTWNINFSLVGFNWMTPNLYIENDSLTNNIHSNFGCFRFQGHLIVTFLLIPFQWGKSNSRALSFSWELCLGMVDTWW